MSPGIPAAIYTEFLRTANFSQVSAATTGTFTSIPLKSTLFQLNDETRNISELLRVLFTGHGSYFDFCEVCTE
jgi:hypothetical protein